MENHHMKEHVWLASFFHYLYPAFVEKQLIKDRNMENAYLQIIHYLSRQNRFFYKFVQSDYRMIEKFVRCASDLCAVEYENSEGDKDIVFRPLQSVFSSLFDQQSKKSFTYSMKPLNVSNILPDTRKNEGSSQLLFSSFLEELKKIKKNEQLIYLFEKYFWCVSSSKSADISLYDEMKTTAAVAVSLYKQYEEGYLKLDELDQLFDKTSNHFLLIHGDVSGIQNFIFSIPSKGAAKSLKGRSVYISLLSDVIVRYLLDKLDLNPTNLLYNGGGNFFILAPYHQQEKLEELRKNILYHLLNGHDGEVYFAIDSVPVAPADFRDFSTVWEKSKSKTNRLKKRKWSELGLESNYAQIFGPIDNGSDETKVCRVCGSFGSKRSIRHEILEDNSVKICTLCQSFIELTNQLRDAKYIVYRKNTSQLTGEKYDSYQDVLKNFGYEVTFYSKNPKSSSDKLEYCYKLNDTNFLDDHCSGFQFGAYQLPKGKEGHATFQELSERAVIDGRGDKKVAHLKLDVDNLGTLFGQGLGDRRSISRVSILSRMLGLYFGGYINQLIKEKSWQQNLYVVFSGGDDTYVVGTWREVFAFAEEFYQNFRTFTCENPYVTFSAGINVFNYQYPLIRAAELTEESLESAKKVVKPSNDGMPPLKNKVTFLNEVFNWEEFKQIKEIESLLEKMVCHYSRNVLYKVNKSTLGFKNILKDSTKGKFQHIKFWRLAYYLRDIKKDYEDSLKKKNKSGKAVLKENYAEQLIEQYRKIVIHNIFKARREEQVRKIMIIPAAIRWTELATRKVEEER
jgi:CRISPR-associated protein Csm1